MSISSALGSAVSALLSQSNALSNISNNLANTSTVGYKATATSFASLLDDSTGETAFDSGGVSASVVSNVGAQGTPESTDVSTDLAISGNGLFTVSNTTSGSGTLEYTRDGQITTTSSGYLTIDGEYLMGWPTDKSGTVTGTQDAAGMTAINVDDLKSEATATSTMSFSGNLPADATEGATYTTTEPIYDSLGASSTLTMTATYQGSNTWSLAYSDSDSSATVSGSPVTVSFNSDGSLASPTSSTLSIGGWSDGASDSSLTLNYGTAGTTTGLTQYSDSSASTMDVSISQNGTATGSLSGITVGSDGAVVATFSNGDSQTIYRIPLATFNNLNGLTDVDGTLYSATSTSGTAQYSLADSGSAGKIDSGYLEESTTNIDSEFSNMMSAQMAYSSAAQVMKTADTMFESFMTSVNSS